MRTRQHWISQNTSLPRDTATCPPLLNKGLNVVHISSKRYVSVTTPSPEPCVLTFRGPWTRIVTSPSLSQFYFQVKSAAQYPNGFPINYDRKVKTAFKQANRTEETKFKIDLPYAINRDLKIRRRRQQRERGKSNRFTGNTQNSNFARASHFFDDYDVKMPHFMFYTGRKQATTKFSFSFMTWIRQLEIQLYDSTGTVNAGLVRKNYFMLFSEPFGKVLEQYKNSWCLPS